jgi:hypothetical protein
MPQHRCNITKDGISFFPLIVFKRKYNFNLQTRGAILREGTAHGEINPPFLSTKPAFFQQSWNAMKIVAYMI